MTGLALLSYAEVADELGISVSKLSAARKGGSVPKLLHLALLQLGQELGVWNGSKFILPQSPSNECAERLRRYLGLSQAKAAAKYNANQSHVSQMEKGSVPVEKAYLSALQKAAKDEGLILTLHKPKK